MREMTLFPLYWGGLSSTVLGWAILYLQFCQEGLDRDTVRFSESLVSHGLDLLRPVELGCLGGAQLVQGQVEWAEKGTGGEDSKERVGHRSCRKLQREVEGGNEALRRSKLAGQVSESGTEPSNITVKGEAPSQWFWCWALSEGNTKMTDQFPEQALSTPGHPNIQLEGRMLGFYLARGWSWLKRE